MKAISLLVFLSLATWSCGQNRLWLSSGVNTTVLNKKLNLGVSFTGRFYDNQRWDKFFPEFSAKYKVHKYFKPSIDYRYVLNQQRTGPRISAGHRLNFNLNTDYSLDRFDFKFRMRVQYKFNRLANSSEDSYEPDFDNAIRFKSVIKYNIKGSKVDPRIEGELFYNTNNSDVGKQFTKLRIGVGADIKLPNKNVLTIKYRYDYEFNLADPRRFHIISLAHDYTYKKSKAKKSRI